MAKNLTIEINGRRVVPPWAVIIGFLLLSNRVVATEQKQHCHDGSCGFRDDGSAGSIGLLQATLQIDTTAPEEDIEERQADSMLQARRQTSTCFDDLFRRKFCCREIDAYEKSHASVITGTGFEGERWKGRKAELGGNFPNNCLGLHGQPVQDLADADQHFKAFMPFARMTQTELLKAREYATKVHSVTELGVGNVTGSTWAFISGLITNETSSLPVDSKPNKHILHSVDVKEWSPERTRIAKAVSEANGIIMEFHESSSLAINIEPTDLLFIDTFHNYCQVRAELWKHAPQVSQFILLHDTSLYGEKSDHDDLLSTDDQRLISPSELQALKSMYFSACSREADIMRGIWPAVEEFLHHFKGWKLHERLTDGFGLTVLKKN